MFKKKFFKKKPKPKEEGKEEGNKDQGLDLRTDETNYEEIEEKSGIPSPECKPVPFPDRPRPTPPLRNISAGKIFSKEAIVDLPLQLVSSNRRMEDLDDEEIGYASSDIIYGIRRRDASLEEAFLDSQTFSLYKTDSHNPMISKFFFSSQEDFETLSVDEICNKMDHAPAEVQQDLMKYITVGLLPTLRQNNKIAEVFSLLPCKNKLIRNLCINELTELIMNADPKKFSIKELMMLYENGTLQLFTVMAETKKTFTIFQSLIQLGIIFNCFVYTRAIEAVDEWVACINDTKTAIESKSKRVMERKDPDVQVFAETAKCVFDLENVDLDESLLIGEDVNAFLHDFSREDSSIYIEGLAVLYHTGNLMLRQQSKFSAGVQKLVRLSSFMRGSDDEEALPSWYHRLLCLFTVRILQRDHTDVKAEVLEKCEDQLFSIVNQELYFPPENCSPLNCLLFHNNERVRSGYKEKAQGKGIINSKKVTEDYIQILLDKYGFEFDMSRSVSQLSNTFERRQCSFCNVDASITYMFEKFQDESMDVDSCDNTSTKMNTTKILLRKKSLQNELEVLKQLESKDIHRNVTRILVFNQNLPMFYIKERLPGDNLQMRLLETRDKGKIIPIEDLINLIVQAVQAVIYVHRHGCIIRDITTASYGCSLTDNGYFLKLKNFEMAAKPSDFSSGGIINGVIDLDFEGVPARWAAPESLLEGHYSIYSDVWSANILADEILNYAAWPYSDISDSDFDDMVTNIVFTHLKPQGFNRPRRVQSLILEGLASVPDQRLKLEALRERLLEISDNMSGGESYSSFDAYSRMEGTHAKVYDIPPLTEQQIEANSVFERGIPTSIQRYRELDEDPYSTFAFEIAENNSRLEKNEGVKVMEISSDEYYKIDSADGTGMMKVMEKVSDDFLKFTYNRLREIDSSKMCVEPWPPNKSASADGSKQLHYKFPRSRHLLDIALHKELGHNIVPYIELLYELANHIDSFHSAGWIFRCLRAKNVWILETKKQVQSIVVPKFGQYRVIASSESDIHLEQIKVEKSEDKEGIQWLPIEAIKAGLYSKESDVYAFGMITWEIMSAFGQEGVVYDQDEERELTCIPFNYKQSENILQHLIEGYIPEKHVKCPDWFYGEVTRPCLLHQKIDRPSMKTILQILKTRLGKSLPKQNLSIRPSRQQGSRMKSKDVDDYEDINDYNDYDDVEISLDCAQSHLDDSVKIDGTGKSPSNTTPPLLQMRRLPPTTQASYYNKDNKAQEAKKTILRPAPPPPNSSVKAVDTDRIPNLQQKILKGNQHQSGIFKKVKDGTGNSVPHAVVASALTENQDSMETSAVNTCKALPLPKIPQGFHDDEVIEKDIMKDTSVSPSKPSTKRNAIGNLKEQKSEEIMLSTNQTKATSDDTEPEINKKENEKSSKQTLLMDFVPPRPPKSRAHKNYNTAFTLPPPPLRSNNHQPKSKTSATGKEYTSDRRDSVNFSSDFDESATDLSQRCIMDVYKGSDFYGKITFTENTEDTENASDIYQDTGSVGVDKSLGDNDRDSDFYGKLLTKKMKPKTLPKPKFKGKNLSAWREEIKQERQFDVKEEDRCDAKTETDPIYVNESNSDTKPAVPPRKPLNKFLN